MLCKNAKCPEGKVRIRLTDSGGLYLEVAREFHSVKVSSPSPQRSRG
jgi:hypothetical protein